MLVFTLSCQFSGDVSCFGWDKFDKSTGKANILLDSKLQDTLVHEEFFLHLSAFSQQTLHGSSGSAPVAVETQIWVQMQWQRRWSIWAIFAIASGLKRDEIQPTATWRHGLRVNFNSYCIFIHQNFNQKISFGKGGGTNTRNSMKKISFLLQHH